MARSDLCLVRGRDSHDAALDVTGYACRLRSASAAQPMVRSGLRRLHPTARHSRNPDRDRHLSLYAQLGLNNTLTGIVLAHSVLAIPLVVITVASSLKSYDVNQEMVARSLGASRPWAFLTVTLPQIRISVISGALLAFITSLDEVVISLFIAGGDKATLTKRMFNALRDEIDPTIASISTLLIALSVVLLGLSQFVQSRAKTRT